MGWTVGRREVLAGTTALAGCAATRTVPGSADRFVRRRGMRLMRDGKPYRFVGANLWYAAWLAADAPFGDPVRLERELDRLAAMGITNLRIMASAEEGPLRASIRPGFRDASARYDPVLLAGLDRAVAAIARRGMTAVLCLTNFWEWSGGMMTYLSYVDPGGWIDMNDPAHPWPAFPNRNAAFYGNVRAVTLYHDYVRAVVGRVNAVTGLPYRDDPAVMAWQLANEPRPAGDTAHAQLPAFYRWIDTTARLVKALDPNHLVSTGSEGLKGSLEREDIVLSSHRFAAIDYLTAHLWPNNWSWVDERDLASTHAEGDRRTADYLARHVAMARMLRKPLVVEEFGYPRDGGSRDPGTATTYRDRFYRGIHDAVLADAAAGGPTAGTNFWAWNGEARTPHRDHKFRAGDRAYMGDPPHEPQGWYGVFDTDRSTIALIRDHATRMASLPTP